jgi:hypothetical protein
MRIPSKAESCPREHVVTYAERGRTYPVRPFDLSVSLCVDLALFSARVASSKSEDGEKESQSVTHGPNIGAEHSI